MLAAGGADRRDPGRAGADDREHAVPGGIVTRPTGPRSFGWRPWSASWSSPGLSRAVGGLLRRRRRPLRGATTPAPAAAPVETARATAHRILAAYASYPASAPPTPRRACGNWPAALPPIGWLLICERTWLAWPPGIPAVRRGSGRGPGGPGDGDEPGRAPRGGVVRKGGGTARAGTCTPNGASPPSGSSGNGTGGGSTPSTRWPGHGRRCPRGPPIRRPRSSPAERVQRGRF